MDKILEKLAGVLTAEDLQEIKESFESAAPVDEIPAEEAAEVPSADIPAGEETAENPDKKPLV